MRNTVRINDLSVIGDVLNKYNKIEVFAHSDYGALPPMYNVWSITEIVCLNGIINWTTAPIVFLYLPGYIRLGFITDSQTAFIDFSDAVSWVARKSITLT